MSTPRTVVIVGTDHHPFDRLVGWVNDWLDRHPYAVGSFYVQSGTASLAPNCAGSRYLDVAQLDRLLDEADVLICHGGPASIADAWRRGKIPIVVPRLRRLGEHVDDHQVDFCRKFAELGRVRLAEDPDDLGGLLAEAMVDRLGFVSTGQQADVDRAVARFGALVNEMISERRHRPPPIVGARRFRRARPAGGGMPGAAGELPADSPFGATGGSSAPWVTPGIAQEGQQ